MAANIKPVDLQEAAKQGMKRMQRYRAARAMFIKDYVGQYYAEEDGLTGEEPLNLLYNAVRILTANYVMKEPEVGVYSPYPNYKTYADLLSLGIEHINKKIGLKGILRDVIVDAMFGFGMVRTGLSSSNNLITIDNEEIDPGQIFTERVDIDNLIVDPSCKKIMDGAFIGDIIEVPRDYLLELDGINTKLVRELPAYGSDNESFDRTETVSQRQQFGNTFLEVRDIVRVAQLWIPENNLLVMIPDPMSETQFKDYLRVEEYFGPEGGPYTMLSLSPPVPNNPFPIAPVSIWFDLHRSANRMFAKVIDQAERQKDILLYKASHADVAQDIFDAVDGECIETDDPNAVSNISIGGQNNKNEVMLNSLQNWFSIMSGNTEQLGGVRAGGQTATEAQILQGNASITVEDGRDAVYDFTADLCRKQAWYLHTDPFIELPMIKRRPGEEDEYVTLTAEDIEGDFLDYNFEIKMRSMSKLNPQTRAQQMMQMATSIIPSAAQAAQVMMQMGMQFDLSKFIINIAKELDMADWIAEIFKDPDYFNKLAMMQSLGPQNAGKAEQFGGGLGGITQNGQSPMAAAPPPADAQQQMNVDAQQTAALGQQNLQAGGGL